MWFENLICAVHTAIKQSDRNVAEDKYKQDGLDVASLILLF